MSTPSWVNEIARGLRVAGMISGYIIGPMVIFGAIGYGIDRYFHTNKLALIISLAIAFFSSNIYIIKQARTISELFLERPPKNTPK